MFVGPRARRDRSTRSQHSCCTGTVAVVAMTSIRSAMMMIMADIGTFFIPIAAVAAGCMVAGCSLAE